ncbi:MAG TPA: CaiB/BaiF CoA-transferase family protein [Candidatus Sulfotelmatobacter sp.]|nr:CaiB/BaiF CoA-transferase family protein [Candidatus Sulfotelmatobacter sp.]
MESADLPLAGIRVVEFVHMIMGPSAGLILGDLGAEVIKVEPLPRGDNTRRLVGSGIGFFLSYNRNKKSLGVDLKSAGGREIVLRLIKSADILTENFRPGAMDKLGFGYAALKAINPELIYCSHKGFLAGPYEHRPALDEVVQMMGGLAYMTGPPGRPLRAGASVNDVMGGMFAVIGALAALLQRQKTKRGQEIKSALFENCAFLVGQHMAQYALSGVAAEPMPNRLSAWGIYDVFGTKDGQQMFVGVVTDTQWELFCKAFDVPDWLADPDLRTNNQRCESRARLLPMAQALFARYTKAELAEMCERTGLPYAPITKPEELFDDPHLVASGALLPVSSSDGVETVIPGLPLEMDGHRFGVRLDVPKFGEHTRSLLAELGYGTAEIERLVADGVVADRER